MTAETPYGMNSENVDVPAEDVYQEQADVGLAPDPNVDVEHGVGHAKGDLDHGLAPSGPDTGADGLPLGLGSENTQDGPVSAHADQTDELAHGLGSGGTDVDPRRVVDEAKEGLPYGLGSENSQDAEHTPLAADSDVRTGEYGSTVDPDLPTEGYGTTTDPDLRSGEYRS